MRKFILLCCAGGVLLNAVDCVAASYRNVQMTPYTTAYYSRDYETQHYTKVLEYLYASDYEGLQSAVFKGLNVNARNSQGYTPMCTAIQAKRYQWYSMLKAIGANTNSLCMQTVDEHTKRLYAERYYAGKNGYVAGVRRSVPRASTSSVNWWKVGGYVLGGLIIAGGATALALTLGGGGGSSSNSSGNTPVIANLPKGTPVSYPTYPTTTDQTSPDYYLTAEFGGSNFNYAQNFLGQINAQYAYAYAKKAGQAVAGQGVIIGELDSGVDYSHSELSNQIARDSYNNKLGINFRYGPCRNSDTTNCWVVDSIARTAKFYNENGIVTLTKTLNSEKLEFWEDYAAQFPSNYDWDNVKNVPVIYGDEVNHGTHVAGIMVAQKNGTGMHGVAYNAKLIGASVTWGWYAPEDPIYGAFKYMVDNGARVINNSWGLSEAMSNSFFINENYYNYYFGDSLKPALSYAAHASSPVISVFAAGNDADNTYGLPLNANLVAAAPMADPSLLFYRDAYGTLKPFDTYPDDESKIVSSLFITVVSLDENNQLAWYSQKCGPAAKWCIAAPGGDSRVGNGIVSTVSKSVSSTGYTVLQGTSMATPVVTSSLAVIMAAFPSLSAQEAVAILFETATNLGNEDLYGHGLINLQAAMAPVGTLSVPIDNTTFSGVRFDNTKIILPRSFWIADNLPKNMMVVDKYERGFNLPVNELIRSTKHSKQAFANDLKSFTYARKKKNVPLSKNLSFSFSDTNKAFDNNNFADKSFALTWQHDDFGQVSFSFTGDNALNGRRFIDKALVNPFTSSLKQVYALSNTVNISDDFRFSVSGSVGKNNFFDGNEQIDPKNDKTAKIMQTGLTYQPFNKMQINLTGGLLNEDSSVLGMSGYGAFNTKDSNTYFSGIEVNTTPMDKLHVDVGYYRGYTKGKQHNAFISISDVYSESFGLNVSYDVNDQWLVGINTASPLRVTKGNMSLNLPIARDNTEKIVYRQKDNVSLSGSKRELDFGIYARKQTDYCTLQMAGLVRTNPDHQDNLKPDYRLMWSISVNY